MNPDVSACSQGGVHLYSSCFSLFKSSVASFYSIFSWQSPTLSSLFSLFSCSLYVTLLANNIQAFLTSTECLEHLMSFS